MPNNFATTIANVDLRSKALRSFKDDLLLMQTTGKNISAQETL
jgi:hypothetical protein